MHESLHQIQILQKHPKNSQFVTTGFPSNYELEYQNEWQVDRIFKIISRTMVAGKKPPL